MEPSKVSVLLIGQVGEGARVQAGRENLQRVHDAWAGAIEESVSVCDPNVAGVLGRPIDVLEEILHYAQLGLGPVDSEPAGLHQHDVGRESPQGVSVERGGVGA